MDLDHAGGKHFKSFKDLDRQLKKKAPCFPQSNNLQTKPRERKRLMQFLCFCNTQMNTQVALKTATHISSYILVKDKCFNSHCKYNPMSSYVPLDIQSYTYLLHPGDNIKKINTVHANILIFL